MDFCLSGKVVAASQLKENRNMLPNAKNNQDKKIRSYRSEEIIF